MELTLTPLPTTHWATDVLPDTNPLSGVVTMTARPARHPWVIGQTILQALGARPDVVGTGRNRGEDEELIQAWFKAYAVSLLVIRNADIFSTTSERTYLLDLAHASGCDLALTCDEGAGEPLMQWVTANGGTIHTDTSYLFDYLSRQRSVLPTPPSPHDDHSFPRFLPQADFYLFRARATSLLPPEEFAVVDAHYRKVFREVQGGPFVTAQAANDYLWEMATAHSSPAAALVTIRAAQAAMFTRGTLLKVDLPFFLGAVQHDEVRRLSAEELWSLRSYRLPWRACAVALRDAGLSRDETRSLQIADLDIGGRPSMLDVPLAPGATVFLRAQRALRLSQGASRQDPLIPVADRALAKALRGSAADLGLPLIRAEEPRCTQRKGRLAHGLRASLVPLAPPAVQQEGDHS